MSDLVVPIRRVARFVFILFFVLVGQLTYLQVVRADDLKNDKFNVRTIINEFAKPRGDIVTADNQVVAFSEPSNDQLKFQRVYPQGELFGHITGFQSILVGNTGVESAYNSALRGKRGEEQNVPRVVLSIDSQIQAFLKEQLGSNIGAIVVMRPNTCAIVGMYANPSYDPNPIAVHDSSDAQKAYTSLVQDKEKPSVSRAFSERYPPGSTFKIVTAAAAIETGIADAEREFPQAFSFTPPLTNNKIQNFGGGACGGTLQRSFRQSCNVTFAKLGDELKDNFVTEIEKFGFGGQLDNDINVGQSPPLDIDGAVGATAPKENSYAKDAPNFAFAGIGQGLVSASPLSVSLFTSTIANQGFMPTPHVVDRLEDGQGNVTKRIGLKPWKENVITTGTASTVRDFMVDVVIRGTGTRARLKDIQVAGKTGTAQAACASDAPSCPPHAWFTSFAPAEAPEYVVTVFIQKSSGSALSANAATGGQLAAPIAKAVYEKLFGLR
ncbi:MAG TPA: penicillin-binding transpeptidase domain-containing protein [Acidimicrobiia bacterium]|nr:penicillin-binding transpeptidase domain-containing protein [Acidimicrobiia bacterium]